MGNWLSAIGRATPAITQAMQDIQERPKQEARWGFEQEKMGMEREQFEERKAVNKETLNKMEYDRKQRQKEEERKASPWMAEDDLMFIGWPDEQKNKALNMLQKTGVINEKFQGTMGGRDEMQKMVQSNSQVAQWVGDVEKMKYRNIKDKAREVYTKLSETPGADPEKVEKARQDYMLASKKLSDITGQVDKLVETMETAEKYGKLLDSIEKSDIWKSLSDEEKSALKLGAMEAVKTGSTKGWDKAMESVVKKEGKGTSLYSTREGAVRSAPPVKGYTTSAELTDKGWKPNYLPEKGEVGEKMGQNWMLLNGSSVISYDGGRTYITSGNQTKTMPPTAVKVPGGATLGEIKMEQAREQARSEMEGGAGISKPSPKEAALAGTGPYGRVASAFEAVAGGLGLDLLVGEKEGFFPNLADAKQFLRSVKQMGKAALMNSSRGAIWEQQKIDQLFPDPDKTFTNPRIEARKFGNLLEVLAIEKKFNNEAIINAITPKEMEKYRNSNNEIDRLLSFISEPQGGGVTTKEKALIEKYLKK